MVLLDPRGHWWDPVELKLQGQVVSGPVLEGNVELDVLLLASEHVLDVENQQGINLLEWLSEDGFKLGDMQLLVELEQNFSVLRHLVDGYLQGWVRVELVVVK